MPLVKTICIAVFLAMAPVVSMAQTASVSVIPEADAFVRSTAPSNNYGGAGAISVSGSAAVNATNQQNGLFDSLIRFPMSNVVAALDAALGTNTWAVTNATLSLTEMGTPPSPIFNRGVGVFEIRWVAADSWAEGIGVPIGPTTNGVVWNDLPSLLNPSTDVSLGVFTNSGVDGRLSFNLSLPAVFLSDIRSGTKVTLYLTAASPQVGFTADSRTFVLTNDFPVLTITAAYRLNGSLMVSNIPDADAFLRSQAPSSNYGGGGALAVSGLSATNGSGQPMGAFDSLMRFPVTNVVASFDGAFGPQAWVVTDVSLVLSEMAAPDNDIFNRGVGAFEVRWVSSDNWIEGTGKPKMPTTDGVAWQDLPGILNSNLDASLGVFTNNGADQAVSFTLGRPDQFISDIKSGGDVGLYLTAVSPNVGFTFNSRDFGNTNARPQLLITAAPDPMPRIDSLTESNGVTVLSFHTLSNWTCVVQGAGGIEGPWTNLLIVPKQATNDHIMFQSSATNRQTFYRLSLSP